MKKVFFLSLLVITTQVGAYTRQDTLRGSNGRGRDWWDVLKYGLQIKIDTATHEISGAVAITFKIIANPRDSMQIDLQEGFELLQSEEMFDGPKISAYESKREGNVYWITRPSQKAYQIGKTYTLDFSFKGKPRTAINPPWDGGFIWTKDSLEKPWIAVACQGLGASSWWPCKDYQGDEPDDGMFINFENTSCISNGRPVFTDSIFMENPITGAIALKIVKRDSSLGPFTKWNIKNPINTYNTTFYMGDYAHWHDTLHGENGVLDLDFYPLKYNLTKAKKQWSVTKEMLRCYEFWLGPFPFYEDGYKLVEAPYLGMEHQSAIAYGNKYKMGYLGHDRSGTGIGMNFDYIIIHESAHEWFGNSITAQDIADNWLHEGFTTYVESLFAGWIMGEKAGFEFCQGEWNNIRNDKPVIGDYGVNDDGSNDKYDKGAAVVFMIRQMINNDSSFRQLLREMNKQFYHKIVTSKELEDYISAFVGKDLKPFFDVYLRSTKIPILTWLMNPDKKSIRFQWGNAPIGFEAPFEISIDGGKSYEHRNLRTQMVDGWLGKKLKHKKLIIKPLGLFEVKETIVRTISGWD